MRISRIYTNQTLLPAAEIELEGQTAHYLTKVLRLGPGAALRLFNGDGHEYAASIAAVHKKNCTVEIGEQFTPQTESALHTVLGIGISRGERMDYAVQKSTELGVSQIVPLFTQYCEVRLAADRQEKRQEHWQQIAISAAEQSGRVRIPVVKPPMALTDWVLTSPAGLCLLFDHTQQAALGGPRPENGVALLTGPEGGLSANEIRTALDAGFVGIALGARVLRTETAPVAALSVMQYLWG